MEMPSTPIVKDRLFITEYKRARGVKSLLREKKGKRKKREREKERKNSIRRLKLAQILFSTYR